MNTTNMTMALTGRPNHNSGLKDHVFQTERRSKTKNINPKLHLINAEKLISNSHINKEMVQSKKRLCI